MEQEKLISHTPGENVTENRNKYLGGSDLPALFNVSPFKDCFTLAREKAGVIPAAFKGNEYTRYGQLLEPQIRDYINSIYELKFKENTNINEELGLRSNCDGLDKDAGLLLEIKTNAGDKTTYEDVYDYVLQMQMYMFQFNVEKGYLVQYKRPENFWSGLDYETQHTDDYFNQDFDSERISVMEIKRDDKLIQQILSKAEKFWIDVERLKENPEMTEEEFYFNDRLVEYNNTINKLSVLEKELARLSDMEKEAKTQREILYGLMDNVGVKTIVTNNLMITKINPTTTKNVDSKKLKEELPEIYDKYTKISNKKGYVKITVRADKNIVEEIKEEITSNKNIDNSKKSALAALGL
ncbi:YqaJ viral recombinase family protein [Fusobacterium sp. 27098_8_59]|jgi:possible bacteriophage endonuclease|uniref:YqaJ viral recombinase family protein n=1 Tax=Fusobacterium sp. 27098_8_59 TaxID=3003691 RepID=UPI00205752E4|nr:MAG TPA: Exonuclease [Caudoviricetes sp.]